MTQHIPTVVITTPRPTSLGLTPGYATRVTIDGKDWAVEQYTIDGATRQSQKMTITFLADVTVQHPREDVVE